ncbi:MAG: DUF6149 family protein [Candidatus Nanohaloarchaea archaeon]|nr:DUF6149 family protein [Candidatus Nanohaloarchaea archaeon]
MKIYQNSRHRATKKALQIPVIKQGLTPVVRRSLVRMHTSTFLDRADPEHRENRTEYLQAMFGATIESYIKALEKGHTEAEAREISHIQANWEFWKNGWTEMMEFTGEEVEPHHKREAYQEFFGEYSISPENPLGILRPEDMPDAERTPEKLENPEYPNANNEPWRYADDLYVETDKGLFKGGGLESDGAELIEPA